MWSLQSPYILLSSQGRPFLTEQLRARLILDISSLGYLLEYHIALHTSNMRSI